MAWMSPCHLSLWPSPARTTLSNLLYALPRSCQTPASTFWCVRRAGTGTPRRARNVHAHARARTACVADAPGHVVAPPAPSLPLFSLCARRTTATPATLWTRPTGRGNPVHHAMADAIRHGCQDARTMTSATVPRFHRNHALHHRQDLTCTPASLPSHQRPCSRIVDADLTAAPQTSVEAIKGGPPSSIQAHHHSSLTSLSLLDPSTRSIHRRSQPIRSSEPRRC
jgi:hypothetical protein